MRPVLLHISNDYPDPVVPHKTKAIQSLVVGTPQYRHIVYSLNRGCAFSGLSVIPFDDDRICLTYGALPKGIFWKGRLGYVANWIASDLKSKGISPSLIHAHKLTIEGIIGLRLMQELKCPLLCDLQGYTDYNMLIRKPSFHKYYIDIIRKSSAIFSYSPWPIKAFESKLGLSFNNCHALPVVPTIENMSSAPIVHENKFLSVFHLDGWKNKNFKGMALAVKKLRGNGDNILLDIYGAGSPNTMLKLERYIESNNLRGAVNLKGYIDSQKISETMKKYVGFVMPSHSETYGLVYVEALFSGIPILLNEKRGISGYFNLSEIGYGCDSLNINDIANGMKILIDRQKTLKINIDQMQKRGFFDFMLKHNILKTYTSVVDDILGSQNEK